MQCTYALSSWRSDLTISLDALGQSLAAAAGLSMLGLTRKTLGIITPRVKVPLFLPLMPLSTGADLYSRLRVRNRPMAQAGDSALSVDRPARARHLT